jgi:hypothetical protein
LTGEMRKKNEWRVKNVQQRVNGRHQTAPPVCVLQLYNVLGSRSLLAVNHFKAHPISLSE